MENWCCSADWPGRSLCLPQPGSCWIKGALWMKSQTAVSVWFALCDFSKRIKNISLKRGSVFAFGMTENWATLVNGDKAEKQKECHLPDKLHCAAVVHKHKHHTATLSICHTPSATHTYRAALANKSWKWPFQGPETLSVTQFQD